MTTTGTLALWTIALVAAYLTLAPVLDMLSTTFSSLSLIGL